MADNELRNISEWDSVIQFLNTLKHYIIVALIKKYEK